MFARSRPLSLTLLLLAACAEDKDAHDSGSDVDTDTDSDSDSADHVAPTVSLTAPLEGATLGGTVAFAASASDDVGVEAVAFFVDGAVVGEAAEEPWSLEWDATGLANGSYVVAAVARDAAGNEASASADVLLDHDGGLDPDSVRVTNPTDGATLCGTVTVLVSATSEVEQVVFSLDGLVVATDDTAPFTWEWNTLSAANAAHALRATGLAADGRAAQETLTVAVENTGEVCDNLPSIRFTSPEADAYGNGDVEIAASASDDAGVLGVQFFVDNGLILDDVAIPYGVSWDTDAFDEGPHSLKAVARDTMGQTAEALRTFTVDRTAPTVSFTTPASGETLAGTVLLTTEAADDLALESVTLQVDGVDLETRTEAPFAWELDTVGSAWGAHTFRATARDRAGNTATDTLDVAFDNPPDIGFVAPADGDTVSGLVRVELTATDDEAVASVELFVDGASYGSLSRSPYTYAWDTCALSPAIRTLTAEATDRGGNVATTVVTVTNDQELYVELGATENDPTTGPSAYVVDDDGGVSVDFLLDGAVIETVTRGSGSGGSLGGDCDSTVYLASSWRDLGVSSGTYVLGVSVTNAAGDVATASTSVTLDADVDGDGYDATDWGGDDCDDGNAGISPAADEAAPGTCDSVDNDCDGRIDEAYDLDGDGAYTEARCPGDEDCDDSDGAVYPGAPEVCGDGVDQDCSTAPVCGVVGAGDLADAQAKLRAESASDSFGTGVWSADVNDDGWSDVLVTAYGDDDGGTDAGAAYVFYGPTFADTGAAGADAKLVGESSGDYLMGVGAGDLDGDGVVDVVLGTYGQDRGGPLAGAVYMLAGPITGDLDLGTATAKVYGESSDDFLGVRVLTADVDGDGLDDIVSGAQNEDLGGTNAGAAYVIYGPLSGTTAVAVGGAKLFGERTSDIAGRSVGAGDFDGDGAADVLVGADSEDSGGTDAGAVYLLLGAPAGDVDLSTADAKLVGETAGDNAGWEVTTGDLDGDGTPDAVVAATDNTRGGSGAGAAYVVFGTPSGTVSLATADAILTGAAADDEAGYSLATVDYDGDGALDLLVGATGVDTGAANAGAVYVVFGPLSGTASLSTAGTVLLSGVVGSLAGADVRGEDLDGNGYGDVIVGAAWDTDVGRYGGAAYVSLGGPGE